MIIAFKIGDNEEIILNPVLVDEGGDGQHYKLQDNTTEVWMEIKLNNNSFEVISKKESIIEDKEIIDSKLDQLVLSLIELEQSGTENTESDLVGEMNPFNPEDIKVHAKQFSFRLVSDMIDDGDIDLSPDFQRNLVWNNFQKSRLIESILLRIPLPMFYFSEDDEGRITIVDGLQRLTTIKEFMNNEFALRNLEYLRDSCEGLYYKDDGKKKGIDVKYLRWFKQTQFSVNVIDPSSPPKVKYDIFRRINTGGKPLNNQEIRNCLAGSGLRDTLNAMAGLEEFKQATDWGIKSTRMLDNEVALRFILFYRMIEKEGNIQSYNGYMDASLDDLTEELSRTNQDDLKIYLDAYSRAMNNAEYLFGRRYAFRKVRPKDIVPGAYKQLINKALFVNWSILLADLDPTKIRLLNLECSLLEPLANAINNDQHLLNLLSYGTNGKANLLYVFEVSRKLIEKHIKWEA